MWSPTHVQVTVQRAKGLLLKGKNGTNDCFVTIGLGKEKFQTSVKEKCPDSADWREECDLPIPSQGNTAEVVLTVLHRNFVADQFLGQIAIPLADFDVYETPRNRWYKLENKPGKDKSKKRGEIEVKIGFTVKEGSLNDLSKKDKHKSSMGQLSAVAHNVGGSLLSIGSLEKRKGLKKFAKNLGSKMNLNKKEKKVDTSSVIGSANSINNSKSMTDTPFHTPSKQIVGEADPGVISEDDDEFAFDDLSHKSSGSSLNVNNSSTLPRTNKYIPSPANASLENLGGGELLRRSTSSGVIAAEKTPPPKPVRLGLDDITQKPPVESTVIASDEWSKKLYNKNLNRSQLLLEKERSATLNNNKSVENINQIAKEKSPKFFAKFSSKEKMRKTLGERIIIGEEGIVDEAKINPAYSKIPKEAIQNLESKSREELIVQLWSLQNEVEGEKKKVKDLENYLDELLLRVMETTPRILQNPYSKNGLFFKNK